MFDESSLVNAESLTPNTGESSFADIFDRVTRVGLRPASMADNEGVIVVSDDEGPSDKKTSAPTPQWSMEIEGVNALKYATKGDPDNQIVNVLYLILCGMMTTLNVVIPVTPWASWVCDTLGPDTIIYYRGAVRAVGTMVDDARLNCDFALMECLHKMMLESNATSYYKAQLFWVLRRHCGESTRFRLVRIGKQLTECHATIF